MTAELETKRVAAFYSWQSDLPDKTNRGAIRGALKVAATRVEAEIAGIDLVVDEATRGMAGSGNIPAMILAKIDVSDIFVCDVTTITEPSAARKCPNPNVVFELGYAVALHGWQRIILLFNEEFGALDDLPFDFDRHRVSTYRLADNSPAHARRFLEELLKVALLTIIRADPIRPADERAQQPQQVSRARDLRSLKKLMSNIHLPTLRKHLDSLPERIPHNIFHFWEGFRDDFESPLFRIRDLELKACLQRFHDAWDQTLSYGQHYLRNSSGSYYIFGSSPNDFVDEETGKDLIAMRTAERATRTALDQLLQIIEGRYHEIDVNLTSDFAWAEFTEFNNKADSASKNGG